MNISEIVLKGWALFSASYGKKSPQASKAPCPNPTAAFAKGSFAFGNTQADQTASKKRQFSDLNHLSFDIQAPLKKYPSDFNSQIIGIRKQLKEHEALHNQTKIQSRKRASAIKLAHLLSNLLIDEAGNILGIFIEPLRKSLFGSRKVLLPYEEDILYILNELETRYSLREKFNNIAKPDSPNNPANLIIRIMLGLGPNAEITDRHAKLAAMSALFSHLRQGNSGSCFATFIAINQLTADPEKCLDDFQHLIKHGKLTRTVNNQIMEFPFLIGISRDAVDEKVKIDPEGNVLNGMNSCPLSTSPGFKAIFDSIGLHGPEMIINKSIKKLFNERKASNELQITVLELIRYIVAYISKYRLDISEPRATLETKAILAFEAQTSNLLQRVWEISIAGMAEAEKGSMHRKQLISSVVKPLNEKMKKIHHCNKILRKRILTAVKEYLAKDVRLLFDPSYHVQPKIEGTHVPSGGFILYDMRGLAFLHQWKRIDISSKFSDCLKDVLNRISKNLKALQEKDYSKGALAKTVRKLKRFVYRSSFLKASLTEFNPKNKEETDLLQNLVYLEHTPWADRSGNNPKRTLKVYSSAKRSPSMITFNLSNPQTLLLKLVQLGKEEQDKIGHEESLDSHKLQPLLMSDEHAFSLMLGHKSLTRAWESSVPIQQWIQSSIIQPGVDIANSKIPQNVRGIVLEQFCKSITLSEKTKEAFLKEANAFPADFTYKQFRSEIHDIIQGIGSAEIPNMMNALRELDDKLFNFGLSARKKRAIRRSAVHFGNSNWNSGIR